MSVERCRGCGNISFEGPTEDCSFCRDEERPQGQLDLFGGDTSAEAEAIEWRKADEGRLAQALGAIDRYTTEMEKVPADEPERIAEYLFLIRCEYFTVGETWDHITEHMEEWPGLRLYA